MASATWQSVDDGDFIKIEDSPEPEIAFAAIPEAASPKDKVDKENRLLPDPKDPEGFLRRCSGWNKKTKLRCMATIGKNSKNTQHSHFTFLPTCYSHRDQHNWAGWCQFMQPDGERCGRLFRWAPPNFELCFEHQGHPDTPCFLMQLPLELRLEIFSYLMPTEPIGSSISPIHRGLIPYPDTSSSGPIRFMNSMPPPLPGTVLPPPPVVPPPMYTYPIPPTPRRRHQGAYPRGNYPTHNMTKSFPFPLLDLFLTCRQIYAEVKDYLFSTVPFTIDIRKEGAFMCGRRLLEPRRADGTAHFSVDSGKEVAQRFINTFDFASVKNYNVDILVENGEGAHGPNAMNAIMWDEEVELYDIRDYVGVAVTGILSKARNLCRLNVRVGLSKFTWSEEELITNVKTLVGPFQRLRNVRQPRICGIYDGTSTSSLTVINNLSPPQRANGEYRSLCSIPRLPDYATVILGPGSPEFDTYKTEWEQCISQTAKSMPGKPPIRHMFSEFKSFFTELSAMVPDVQRRIGKHAFLHRARVAREKEDIEAFRHLRNELIEYWYMYLEQEEQKKESMNKKLSEMLDTDVYPTHEMESSERRASSSSDNDASTPSVLNVEKMVAEGIPMTANHISMNLPPYTQQQTQLQAATHTQLMSIRQQQMLYMRQSQLQPRQILSGQQSCAYMGHTPPFPAHAVQQSLIQRQPIHTMQQIQQMQQQQLQQQQLQQQQRTITAPQAATAIAGAGSTSPNSHWQSAVVYPQDLDMSASPAPSPTESLAAWMKSESFTSTVVPNVAPALDAAAGSSLQNQDMEDSPSSDSTVTGEASSWVAPFNSIVLDEELEVVSTGSQSGQYPTPVWDGKGKGKGRAYEGDDMWVKC